MKINRLFTRSFGKFKSEKWSDLSPGINVFYGENEAGKSTVFKMISRTFFGFKTISKDKNLLLNQETGMLHLGAELEVNGQVSYIERELLSKAKGVYTYDGQQIQIDNQPIELVDHIDRMTYEGVYALDLNELTAFKDNAWQEIEELLMRQYSGDVFNSPQSVLEDIEAQMKKIKKQSDRGNSIIKSLEEERRKVIRQKKLIRDNLAAAEEIGDKIQILDRKLNDLEKTKYDLEHQKRMLEIYLPVMRLRAEKDMLESKLEGFKSLANTDEYQYKERKKQLKKLYINLEEVSSEVTKIVSEKRRLSEKLQNSQLTENELKDMIQKHMQAEELSLEKETMKNALMLKEDNFKKAFEETFDEKFRKEHYDEVLALNYLNLKSLVKEIEEIYEEIKIVKRNKRSTTATGIKGKVAFMVILALAGGAAIYLNYNLYLNYASAFAIGFSITNSIHMIVKNKNKLLDEEDLYLERDALKARLLAELNGIKLSPIAEEFIGQEFLSQIVALKNLAEVFVADEAAYNTKFKQFMTLTEEVNVYLNTHVGEVTNKAKHFDELMDILKQNQKDQSRIEVINGQLDVLNNQLQSTEKDLNEQEEWIKATEGDLIAIGGSIDEGLLRLNSKAQDVLRHDEIIRKLSVIDYSEDVLKSFTESYVVDEQHDELMIQTRIDKINQDYNETYLHKGGLEKDEKVILDQSDMASVDSELKYLDTKLKEEKLKYDKLLLMHHLIKTTDEKFRANNQPRVFKQASEYLSQITDGKYSDLEVIELKEGGKSKYGMMLTRDKARINVDESFSLGTLNQIYLSLRLSLINHLDYNHSKLPVCFDELLVNWDQNRLNQTIKIIKTISQERQVFVFTCHKWFADAIKEVDDSKVYML